MKTKDSEKVNFFDGIKKSTDRIVKIGTEFSKVAAEKIDSTAKIGSEKAKESMILNKVATKTTQATRIGIEKGKEIQENSPRLISKIGKGTLTGLEKVVGTIRKGTQYGKTSIEMLEQLAKMKELGIISEEEYEEKKREIFNRI